MKSDVILKLNLRTVPQGAVMVTHETVLTYTAGARSGDLREPLDYGPTNRLFNSLYRDGTLGADLEEIFSAGGTGLWQFIPSYSYPSFFRAVELIRLLVPLLDEVRPSRVESNVPEDEWEHIWIALLQELSRTRGFSLKLDRRFRFNTAKKRLFNFMRVQGWVGLARIFRRNLQFFNRVDLRSKEHLETPVLFLTQGSRHWTTVPGDPQVKHDEQFELIRRSLGRSGFPKSVFVDCQPPSPTNLSERDDDCSRWTRFWDYAERGDLRTFRDWFAFRRKFRAFMKSDAARTRFEFQGVHLLPVLRVEFSRIFHELLPEALECVRTARSLLEKEKPAGAIVTYETGPFQRALLIAGDRMGVPCIGLQHGMIFKDHYDYTHSILTAFPAREPHAFAIPKIICVWGEFWKTSLVKLGSYPIHAVRVAGTWRIGHDRAAQIQVRKAPLSTGVRRVLILSGGQEVARFIEETLRALRELDISEISIKLHPIDDPEPVLAMMEKHGLPADALKKDQLFEHMETADLVVGQGSTTIAEALLMGKNVVLLNPENYSLPSWYGESGAVAYVTDYRQLTPAIQRIFSDPRWVSEMKTRRAEWITTLFAQTGSSSADDVTAALMGLMSSRVGTVNQRADISTEKDQ